MRRGTPWLIVCAVGMQVWTPVAYGLAPSAAGERAAASSIPAGALDQVLRAYALASGVLLSADGRLTVGLRSAGLQTLGEPQRDLELILSGTGLRAERQTGGMFLLVAAPTAAAAPSPSVASAEAMAVQHLPAISLSDTPAPPPFVSRFALKTATPLADIPQAISIIDSKQIHEQGMQSMADVVEYVAGVQASQGEGNRDNVVFRGYNSSADFFLDGTRDDVQYYRDFYNIDSVEVLKGPNAVAMGRGGSGGVVNRVGKQAQWRDIGEASLMLGSWRQRRASLDVGAALDPSWAWRLNAVSEQAGSFRDGVRTARYGVNPALAWRDRDGNLVTVSAEHFKDWRNTDRGVPSLNGRPVDVPVSTFFGDADVSRNWVVIDGLTVAWERELASGLSFDSQIRYAHYDKYYQNVFAGGTDADTATVRLLGYSSATKRTNLFVQSGLSLTLADGGWTHRLSAGTEIGRQRTSNVRTTGYFDTLGTDVRYVSVPLSAPEVELPVSFRASSTDTDNGATADTAAVYLQDQLSLSPEWQLVAGLRYEVLKIDFLDSRKQAALSSLNRPLSPRVGLVYRPKPSLSLYLNYSQAYMARVGEQLASLTSDTQDLAPEKLRSLELGAKWTLAPGLTGTMALYDLKRSNVLVADATDATLTELADGQKGRGLELELGGRLARDWTIKAAYAWQQSTLLTTQSPTSVAGARMSNVPRQSLSVWTRYQWRPAFGLGLGLVSRSAMDTSTSNLVQMPGYARLDGGLYFRLSGGLRLQANIENLLDRVYYKSAYNDNNITPGSPRAVRLTLDTSF